MAEQEVGDKNVQPTREEVATLLERIADLLEAQGANAFRIRSYRDGARTVRATDKPLVEMAAREDEAGLKSLPDIGQGLARVIIEYITSGRSSLLEELQGEVSPADLFQQVPGIGEELAQRIVSELDISTLPELEQAAHDGRLDKVPGFGEERLKTVRTSLAGMLSGAAQSHRRRVATGEEEQAEKPPVSLLLELDQEYREKAEADELPTIAPKRFNPEDEAWLPIMHRQQDGWKFTVLYSNTAQAHELNKTHDWVVIYWQPVDDGIERQNTVVTENSGPLAGKRVVRGREEETRRYYRSQQ